ncbi:MAG: class I SAM-dependent methyltransferase [Micrococcaceae bacterium]
MTTAPPPRPNRLPRLDPHQRERLGGAFDAGASAAEIYDAVRPGYPAEVIDVLAAGRLPGRALDVGAGTGLLTGQLVRAGYRVTALEPAADMLQVLQRRHPEITTVHARVEDLPAHRDVVAEHSQDLVTCGQAWHWINPELGTRRLAEVLAPGGVLGIVEHQLNTAVAWVHRLSRIMHAGDVHPVDAPPRLGPEFAPPQRTGWQWEDTVTVPGLHALMATRSYHLRASAAVREKMRTNLNWYLLEHLGHAPDATLRLPYITSAWRSDLVS